MTVFERMEALVRTLPGKIGGKRVTVVGLNRLWGVALP